MLQRLDDLMLMCFFYNSCEALFMILRLQEYEWAATEKVRKTALVTMNYC